MMDPEYLEYRDIIMNLVQQVKSFPMFKVTIDPICNSLIPRYMELQKREDDRLGVDGFVVNKEY